MTPTLPITTVLLRARLVLTQAVIERALESFPRTTKATFVTLAEARQAATVSIQGRNYAIYCDPQPAIPELFAKALGHPEGESLRPLVETHRAHLSVVCLGRRAPMEEAVEMASVVHLLAARLGGFADPLAGFWPASERVCPWDEFIGYGEDVVPCLAGKPDVAFPTRYWVSVQLREGADETVGAHTVGLGIFTGYEINLTPVSASLPAVAGRMVDIVAYLFRAGAVLRDGETLGATEEERFRITMAQSGREMRLDLEDHSTLVGAP